MSLFVFLAIDYLRFSFPLNHDHVRFPWQLEQQSAERSHIKKTCNWSRLEFISLNGFSLEQQASFKSEENILFVVLTTTPPPKFKVLLLFKNKKNLFPGFLDV